MGPLLSELTDTDLHEAVRFADISDVEEALSNNHNPNQIGLYQWAPIHEASHNGELEILELLLKHGGNPNVIDVLNGRTPLHYAAQQGQEHCLMLLVTSGGDPLIQDNDGHTVLDIAEENCLQILKTQIHDQTAKFDETFHKDIKTEDSISHLDSLSVTSSCSSVSSSCRLDNTSALGQIELSFEYDCRKESLRIRVWQITDILVPPASSSMISCIYVKSFLIPDKSRESKRKTEEVKVSSLAGHATTLDKTHCVFTPVTFRFSKPLEYVGVTKDDVSHKTVQIEMCITQKYTRKSFLTAMYCLPCKSAVKKLVRQKYPLIPCNNPTIPDNMKLYNVDRLQVPQLHRVFHSNPDIRCLSQISLNSDSSGYPASDTMLENVTVQRADNCRPPNIVISIPNDDTVLCEVMSIDSGMSEMLTQKETFVSVEGADNCLELAEVTTNATSETVRRSCQNAKAESTAVSEICQPNENSTRVTHKSGFYPVATKSKQFLKNSLGKSKEKVHLRKVKTFSQNIHKEHSSGSTNSPTHSRPNTPTWDNYDIETTNISLSVQSVDKRSGDNLSMRESLLPLPSSLDLPGKESSVSNRNTKPLIKQPVPEKAVRRVCSEDDMALGDGSEYTGNVKDKGKRLLGKSRTRGKKLSGDSGEYSSMCKDIPVLKQSGSRETTLSNQIFGKSISVCKNTNIVASNESTVLDIDMEEVLCELPKSVRDFTIPMQVFITESD